jgi:putative membrane protein
MKLLFKIIILVISNALALYVASRLIPGFNITADYIGFLKIGAVLGIVNTLVRPLIKLLSFPLILLTFGLFSIIINILLLYYISSLFSFFTINSLLAGLLGLIIISIVNSLLINIFEN